MRLPSLITHYTPGPTDAGHSYLCSQWTAQKLRLMEVQQNLVLMRGGAPKPVFQRDALYEGEEERGARGPGAPRDCSDIQGDMSRRQTRVDRQTT